MVHQQAQVCNSFRSEQHSHKKRGASEGRLPVLFSYSPCGCLRRVVGDCLLRPRCSFGSHSEARYCPCRQSANCCGFAALKPKAEEPASVLPLPSPLFLSTLRLILFSKQNRHCPTPIVRHHHIILPISIQIPNRQSRPPNILQTPRRNRKSTFALPYKKRQRITLRA
jgi:hypothetical protein